jgi:hypothetical protein
MHVRFVRRKRIEYLEMSTHGSGDAARKLVRRAHLQRVVALLGVRLDLRDLRVLYLQQRDRMQSSCSPKVSYTHQRIRDSPDQVLLPLLAACRSCARFNK